MKKLVPALCSAAVLAAAVVLTGCNLMPSGPAGSVSPEARAQLAPSGALRVAVLTSNPIIGSRDAKSGAGR